MQWFEHVEHKGDAHWIKQAIYTVY